MDYVSRSPEMISKREFIGFDTNDLRKNNSQAKQSVKHSPG